MGDLGDLNTLSLEERIHLYADGDGYYDIPPRSFDFQKEDTDMMLSALEVVKLLAESDYPHNFQLERFDLHEYCLRISAIQRIAKGLYERSR